MTLAILWERERERERERVKSTWCKLVKGEENILIFYVVSSFLVELGFICFYKFN